MTIPKQNNKEENDFPGYPHYPAGEDAYNKLKKETEIDPENPVQQKEHITGSNPDQPNEIGFDQDKSGADLDIPGSELDNAEELLGSEDEENNYYSIGGDNHENLEEDQGE